jgi:hypothetical protein
MVGHKNEAMNFEIVSEIEKMKIICEQVPHIIHWKSEPILIVGS